MKTIKLSVFAMLLAMMVFGLTACGRNDNAGQNSTSGSTNPSTTQSVTTTGESDSQTESTSTNDDVRNESSTGVIGGMIDDVESGVDDMLDGTKGTTDAADESSR